MLQTEFSHDTFGMLSFLRLIGLRIDGRMLHFFSLITTHDILILSTFNLKGGTNLEITPLFLNNLKICGDIVIEY